MGKQGPRNTHRTGEYNIPHFPYWHSELHFFNFPQILTLKRSNKTLLLHY